MKKLSYVSYLMQRSVDRATVNVGKVKAGIYIVRLLAVWEGVGYRYLDRLLYIKRLRTQV